MRLYFYFIAYKNYEYYFRFYKDPIHFDKRKSCNSYNIFQDPTLSCLKVIQYTEQLATIISCFAVSNSLFHRRKVGFRMGQHY